MNIEKTLIEQLTATVWDAETLCAETVLARVQGLLYEYEQIQDARSVAADHPDSR